MTDPPDSSREPFHIPPRVARRRRRVKRRFEPRPTFGDLLVQQTRSTIGSDEAQRATIETLGLGKIGRCTAVSLDQPAALSQVHAVRHLVAVAPLSRSAERTLGLRGEVTEIKVNRYDLPDRTGAAVNIGRNDSEHVVVERRGDEVVAWWTTALPMASVLKALGPERYRHGIVVAQRGQIASRELSVLDLFDEVLAKRRTPAYVRVEGSAETVGVSTPVYPRHVNHRVTYGEVEVRGELLPWSRLEQLVELTGTPGLAEAISSLEPRFVSLLGGAGDRQ